MSASNNQHYETELQVLQERFPQMPKEKLVRLLRRKNGDIDQVRSQLIQREFRTHKFDSLETRYGAMVNDLQKEIPWTQSWKRFRMLRVIDRFGGNLDDVRKFLNKVQARHENTDDNRSVARRERREELKTKYATQLAELESAGIHAKHPVVFRLLEKHQGDVTKVVERMRQRTEKKTQRAELHLKYATQLAQCQAEGIEMKNQRVLLRLLDKTNGDVNQVKQLIEERKEKHRRRKEYQRKHRGKSTDATTTDPQNDGATKENKKRRELSTDDLENLKRLRAAGVHGDPRRILAIFHQCNESIEMTIARKQQEKEERLRQREERINKREHLKEVQGAYIPLNQGGDWPNNIEQVYLDGNNMMFVVDSLRRLCLNRAGKKTERALAEIAAAWNDQLRIPNVELIFDATNQLDRVGSVLVSSAQPRFATTDDMLLDIARRPENRERNKQTIVVTSDRALAAQLRAEGCQLVKPYHWFAHCTMILTPDLIKNEETTATATATDMVTDTPTPTTTKKRYNFDELVHRIAKIDIA